MKLKKGDYFSVDVDFLIQHTEEYFKDRMPSIAANARKTSEHFRDKIFQVYRTENYGELIVFLQEGKSGASALASKFCKKVKTK